jgi:hypothetical protein
MNFMNFNLVQRTYITIARIDTVLGLITGHYTCEIDRITRCGHRQVGHVIEQLFDT